MWSIFHDRAYFKFRSNVFRDVMLHCVDLSAPLTAALSLQVFLNFATGSGVSDVVKLDIDLTNKVNKTSAGNNNNSHTQYVRLD